MCHKFSWHYKYVFIINDKIMPWLSIHELQPALREQSVHLGQKRLELASGTGFWPPSIPASVIRICTFCLNTHPALLRPHWERFRVLGNLVCRLQRWVFWWVWCQCLTQRSVDFYFRQILRLEPLKWEIVMGKLAFSSQLQKGKICFTEPHPCFWISFSDGPFCYSTLSDFSIPLSLNKETFCLFTSVF